jgi:hypothetical protein
MSFSGRDPLGLAIIIKTENAGLVGFKHHAPQWKSCSLMHTVERSGNLEGVYSSLDKAIGDDELFGCPDCVSLGESGHYFMKYNNTAYWFLPDNITKHLGGEGELPNFQSLWLGKGDTYVAVKAGGQTFWDLKGHYPGLQDKLREKKSTAKVGWSMSMLHHEVWMA